MGETNEVPISLADARDTDIGFDRHRISDKTYRPRDGCPGGIVRNFIESQTEEDTWMNLDSAKQMASEAFADSYAVAREKFLAAAPASKTYPSTAKGPSGEDLFTDAAYIGPPDAKKVLVITSGVHGPEGYSGSAAQVAFFHSRLNERLPDSVAVLLVHAVNCYGFAWNRRATAEGCDLNRNFIDFTKPVPANPGYEELAQYLVPADISPEGLKEAEAAIAAYRAEHGEWRFEEARKSGQYTRPGGMFYGGNAPSEARLTLEQIVAEHDIAERDQVIIVDYHTGLGPFGHGELQCEQSSGRAGYERALRIFGPSATYPEEGNSSSVALNGCVDEYWQKLLGDRHTYVALEYGTYGPERGRVVLRADNWLYAYHPEEADTELGRGIRNACKLHWNPERADWQEMIIWRSHQVHRQALEALAQSK